ncbi:MAG: hypothetical protein ACLQDQ_07305 [Myxococcaceae bacterium]
MAHARTVLEATSSRSQPSLLRLTVIALVLALAFDALSTALAWDVVRALEGAVQRSPVHAVRPADVRRADVPPPSGQAPSSPGPSGR